MAARRTATKTKTKISKKKKSAPRRPRPTAVKRLERGEGDARVFWEITQLGAVIKTRSGKYLAAGRTSERVFDDKAAAAAFFEKAIEAKRAEGFEEPAPKQVIGVSSKKGVTARNPELEALIDEDPSDLSRYLIYADWLQQQSDPRGELIVAQHKLVTAPDDELDALEHIEWKLLRDFSRELLGPLSKYTLIRSGGTSLRALAWRCGFIRAIRWQGRDTFRQENLRVLLEHPSTRFLEMLVTTWWNAGAACDELRERAPKTFTTLSVATGWNDNVNLGPIAEAYPQLRRLWITGGLMAMDPKRARTFERLEELEIGFATPEVIEIMARASFPSVERVHLTLAGFDVVERDEMMSLMKSVVRTFPSATQMRLRRWQVGEPQDDLAAAILTALHEIPNRVTKLNLDLSLSKNPANLVELASALPRTLAIELPVLSIPNPYMRSELSNKVKSVSFVPGDPIERDREDITPFHHAREPMA